MKQQTDNAYQYFNDNYMLTSVTQAQQQLMQNNNTQFLQFFYALSMLFRHFYKFRVRKDTLFSIDQIQAPKAIRGEENGIKQIFCLFSLHSQELFDLSILQNGVKWSESEARHSHLLKIRIKGSS